MALLRSGGRGPSKLNNICEADLIVSLRLTNVCNINELPANEKAWDEQLGHGPEQLPSCCQAEVVTDRRLLIVQRIRAIRQAILQILKPHTLHMLGEKQELRCWELRRRFQVRLPSFYFPILNAPTRRSDLKRDASLEMYPKLRDLSGLPDDSTCHGLGMTFDVLGLKWISRTPLFPRDVCPLACPEPPPPRRPRAFPHCA